MQIACLQVILGDPLLYLVSVSDFPRPECCVFCILIVDIISKRYLVLSSLLCEINYHYNKGTLEFEFLKCKTIHSVLLLIALLQSILLQWVINIVIISNIARYTWRVPIRAIFHEPTTILLFLPYFLLNCHGTLFFSQI